jgi:DNA ligase-1
MDRFAELCAALEAARGARTKLTALKGYFRTAPPADAAWAVSILLGLDRRRPVSSGQLRAWAAEAASLPQWLVEAAGTAVGDTAETLALLLPEPVRPQPRPLHVWMRDVWQRLPQMDVAARRRAVREAWEALESGQRLVWNKLLTGGFRAAASRGLVVRSVAGAGGISAAAVAQRLADDWTPSAEGLQRLLAPAGGDAMDGRPYPFFLASPLKGAPEGLGTVAPWSAEWLWDGLRAQVVRRAGRVFIWSRKQELVTATFPEVAAAALRLPEGTVVDGAILGPRGGGLRGCERRRARPGRKGPGRDEPAEARVVLMAFDLLEAHGQDWRDRPWTERRGRLAALLSAAGGAPLTFSAELPAAGWEDLARLRAAARGLRAQGLMLKHRDALYGEGRRRGAWWVWKADPLTVDAVLLYAQRGRGALAGLYADCTFGVWQGEVLVPLARARGGLSPEELREVDRCVRGGTVARFGPVRSVRPALVFTIAFDAVRPSRRRKAGVALQAPRIVRWRRDKHPREADTLETLTGLLAAGDDFRPAEAGPP